jgi:hypothetical protein
MSDAYTDRRSQPDEALSIAEELIPAPPRAVRDPLEYLNARAGGENVFLDLPAPSMRELSERFADMADAAEYKPEQIAGQPADGFIAEAIAEATGQTPPGPKPILPTDSAERKNTPICTGVFDYFPRALAYISRVSKQGQIQHNLPKLGWDKTKSTDHPDCIARHLIERGTRDPLDGLRHSGKLGWRALANLEIELEEAEKNGEAW